MSPRTYEGMYINLLCITAWSSSKRILTDGNRKFYEGRATGEEYVKLSVYSPPDLARPTFKEATSKEFKKTHVGESFGPSWSTHWFKIQLKVPSSFKEKELLEFHWDANNEGLVWSEHGEPLQGLTGGGERREWIIPKSFRDGEFHTIYIEMACNRMFGNATGDVIQPPNPDVYFQLYLADIVAINQEARALYIDFWIIGGRNPRAFFCAVTEMLYRCCKRVSWRYLGVP